MWKRVSREHPTFFTRADLWVTFYQGSQPHTHTHACTHALMCSDSPQALLRLSSDGPTTWNTERDSLRSTCANKVLEASLVSSPASPSTRPAATHTWTEKGETPVTSPSQLGHYYLLNICWIFLVLFCFRMGWEWMLCHNPNTVKFCIFHILCKNRHLNQ